MIDIHYMMAVDRFGSSLRKSSRAQRGKPGIPGILDFSQWLSKTVLRSLQSYDETACFFIEHSSDVE